MTREVNVYTGRWTNTGATAPVPRYTFSARFEWVDDAGAAHSDDRVYTFPNVLSGIPARRLREYMEEIIVREAMIARGIRQNPDA